MATTHFQSADGARIACRSDGEGPAILMLSGLTRTMADFDYLVPHLPPCRAIRMDYRGRGQSDRTGAGTYTIQTEAQDALALLDHLGVAQAAVIGTSRGGLIGMLLAATAKTRLTGLCLVDVGPVSEATGLRRILDYLGRNPSASSHEDLAVTLSGSMPGFANVPGSRWLEEARRHFAQAPDGLRITYDPALREAFLAVAKSLAAPDWPMFDACAGLPLALIRGAGSDLLSPAVAAEMRRRRPDMIFAEVPDRGHIPFLDEPESLWAIRDFLDRCGIPQ